MNCDKTFRYMFLSTMNELGLEFEDFDQLKRVIDRAIELGVISDWFLFCDNSMRIAPPLIISEAEIKQACSLILQAIEEAA